MGNNACTAKILLKYHMLFARQQKMFRFIILIRSPFRLYLYNSTSICSRVHKRWNHKLHVEFLIPLHNSKDVFVFFMISFLRYGYYLNHLWFHTINIA